MKKIKLPLILAAVIAAFFLLSTATLAAYDHNYTESESIRIIDHVIYEKVVEKKDTHYQVIDYGETPEIAKTLTEINIVSEIDGYPVTELYGDDEYYSFYNNFYPKVTKINIPESVTKIGYYALSNFRNIKAVTLPENLEVLGERAFWCLSKLKKIVIPKKVSYIQPRTFAFCTNLKEVVFMGEMRYIDTAAFVQCENLESITQSKSLVYIGDGAFSDCKKLTSFLLPDTLKEIGCEAFSGSGLTSVTIPAQVEFTGFEDDSGESFADCKQLKKVVFKPRPGADFYLEDSTFENCTALETVVLPEKAESITIFSRAFKNCRKLSSIKNTQSISSIYEAAFAFCSSLTKFVLTDKLLQETLYSDFYFGKKAFYKCTGLKTVIFEGATPKAASINIPEKCFFGCKNLEKVYLPDSKYTFVIKSRAFKNCESLKKIYRSEKITSISTAAFAYCKSLGSITLSSKLSSVGEKAFLGCESLSKVTLTHTKTAPKLARKAFFMTENGIKFYTANKTVANSLQKKLSGTGVKNAKIVVSAK